ncbi:hypothetical protein CY0110_19652 [Crocosphaera chwakensis CCY0110]|uniref:Uncharacterized protein n=1 Tax=Crocosphaera chwakensis CCY0110 TaxID=391612 RepID=A3IJR2_9CHRO|nr:hypothetical protein CY0110_19652 [Crocosphaera chwakensis CCY0110]
MTRNIGCVCCYFISNQTISHVFSIRQP